MIPKKGRDVIFDVIYRHLPDPKLFDTINHSGFTTPTAYNCYF